MIHKMIDEKIDKELNRLKVELTMGGYHDGWCLQWIREKIEELKKLKDDNNRLFNEDSEQGVSKPH